MLEENLPPGKYLTQLDDYKVGDTIKNHFGRKARIKYLYVTNDGRKLLLYANENGSEGMQILNHDWFRKGAPKP